MISVKLEGSFRLLHYLAPLLSVVIRLQTVWCLLTAFFFICSWIYDKCRPTCMSRLYKVVESIENDFMGTSVDQLSKTTVVKPLYLLWTRWTQINSCVFVLVIRCWMDFFVKSSSGALHSNIKLYISSQKSVYGLKGGLYSIFMQWQNCQKAILPSFFFVHVA